MSKESKIFIAAMVGAAAGSIIGDKYVNWKLDKEFKESEQLSQIIEDTEDTNGEEEANDNK